MHYNAVVIPNFGAFEWRYFSADLQTVERKIYPPSYQLVFNSKHQEDPNQRLVQYIAEKKDIKLEAAHSLLVDYRLSIENKLLNKETVLLENWGSLISKKSGEILLEKTEGKAFLDASRGLPIIECHPILRDKSYLNQTAVSSNGRKRPLAAWILAAIAAFLIIGGGVSAIWWWPALMQKQTEPTLSEISIIPVITEQQEQLLELLSAYENMEPEPIASLEEEDIDDPDNEISEEQETTDLATETEVISEDTDPLEEEAATEPSTETAEESNLGPNDYIIVIGVFGEAANYERNANLLREAGYEVQLKKLYTGYTRVAAIVNCNSEQELQEKWAALRQQFTSKAWLAKL